MPSLARMQNLIFLCAFLATNLIWALPNSLQQLCDAKPSSYQSCHRDLHTLSNAQLVLEKDGLFKLLRSESLPINWDIDEWFALKNDLMDRFIAAKQCIVALSAYNLAVLEDNTSHPIWRDYCLQKQADLIAAHPLPSQQCNKLITLLNRFAHGKVPGLIGTALIGQMRLIDVFQFEHPSLKDLGLRAYNVAQDDRALVKDRMSALQIAAHLGQGDQVHTLIYKLLAANQDIQSNTSAMLRVSALATLGLIGTNEDVTILQKYRQSADIRLRAAARSALIKIQNKS